MKPLDLLHIVWRNMWQRKARTIFTMMGVIIGCLAIFLIGSITNGFSHYLNSEMAGLIDGTLISIYPNYQMDPTEQEDDFTVTLSKKSVEKLEEFPFITQIEPKQYASGEITYRRGMAYGMLQATNFEVPQTYELLAGRYAKPNSREIIMGYQTAKELLGFTWEDTPSPEELTVLINRSIQMKIGYEMVDEEGNVTKPSSINLRVVGITTEDNNSYSYGMYGSQELVLRLIKDGNKGLPPEELDRLLNTYDSIDVRIDNSEYLGDYESQLKALGFETRSSRDMQRSMEGMLLGVSVILGSLAGISLLVAALGITNTMDMAIYERNKEIGVMKVVGGSLMDIRLIFVGEACAISATGGIISIIVGVILSGILNLACRTLSQQMFQIQIDAIVMPSAGLVMGILLFSLTIGFIAGIMPANKAVKVDVISAIK